MKKMIFSLEKYQQNLKENGISDEVFKLLSKFDKVYDEDIIYFLNNKVCWGQKNDSKEIIHRDWCVPVKENHFMQKMCRFM
jgi:hypothetical protein